MEHRILAAFLRQSRVVVRCCACGQEFTEFGDVVFHQHISDFAVKQIKEMMASERQCA